MSYMSYCKFEGTRQELASCLGTVYEHVEETAEYNVSDREIAEFRRIVEAMVEFFQNMDLLDENGDINEAALDDICVAMSKAYREEDY